MKTLKKAALKIDSALEAFILIALTAMVFIVTAQVFTRKLFNYVAPWSEEITLLLLVWFAFMGFAIGFREHIHLAMDAFTNLFGERFNRIWDKVIRICTFAFGMYLIVYGWDFAAMMKDSTLPATKLSNSVVYAVMPVTGVMICVYSALQFFGIDTRRHQGLEEENIS